MKLWQIATALLVLAMLAPDSAYAQRRFRRGRGAPAMSAFGPVFNPALTPEWRMAGGNPVVYQQIMQLKMMQQQQKLMQRQMQQAQKMQQQMARQNKNKKQNGQATQQPQTGASSTFPGTRSPANPASGTSASRARKRGKSAKATTTSPAAPKASRKAKTEDEADEGVD